MIPSRVAEPRSDLAFTRNPLAAATPLSQAPILLVDDDPDNLLLLERLLARWGYENVTSTADPARALGLIDETRPSLVLVDVTTPEPVAFDILGGLREQHGSRPCPVLVMTADPSPARKERALTHGASDFMLKPFDRTEVRLRVQNLLRTEVLHLELEQHYEVLEQLAWARTLGLEEAKREILERLALAGEYRDDQTHEHAQRVGRTAALLAAELREPEEDVEMMRRAAPLHDIGKVGVSDSILLKPGPLTREETAIMRCHTTIGSRILADSLSDVLQAGEVIARTHHEHWDGRGYPAGLAGEQIPLAGRLVAVADAFDAMTHERPYKPAWPCDRAVAQIGRAAGQQFDPEVARAFCRLDHQRLLAPVETLDVSRGR